MGTFFAANLTISFILAIALAALALLLSGFLLMKLARLRRDQKVVLGDAGVRDIIAHSRELNESVDALDEKLRRVAGSLDQTGRRVDQCLAFHSVIRYDAYRDLSGMQSSSVALLDTGFSGVIISAIQSRGDARIYVKEVRHGDSKEKLSPEEIQVLKEAMSLKPKASTAVGGGLVG